MNDEFVKEWLQWVVNFIQMDIFKLSRKEKYSFFQKFNWFASYNLFDTSFDPFGISVQFSQNQINEFETIALEIQISLKDFIDQMTTTRATYGLPDLISRMRTDSLGWRNPKDHRVYFQAHFAPKDMTPKNWAVLNLSRLFQGLEMHVIGKCEECGSYFLNFSLRNKVYCSPRCASRSLARLRRERLKKSPEKWEAYKKKQAKATMQNYIKRRAREGKVVRHRHLPARRQKKVEVQVK